MKLFGFSVLFLVTVFGMFIYKLSNKSHTQTAVVQATTTPQPADNSQKVKGIETSINTSTPSPTQSLAPQAAPKKNNKAPVYFGLWTQGFWDQPTTTLHPEALISMENKIGKKVAIAHYYRGWGELDKPQLLSELQTISANGWRPMISANPYFFDKCPSNGMSLYKAIASGNCDQFITGIGKNLKQFGKPIFLRFAWEMNIPSMEWQIGKVGSTNQDFISAWQRMHQIIYSQNATNVLWVFSPDVGSTSYKDIYPGDGYVDWLGLDGYNWGTTQSWSSWQSFSQVFSAAYANISRVAPSKPIMLAEVNTTDQGGDKPAWYKDMLSTQIPFYFPKIRAVVFYNEDRTVRENVNWLIDISQASLNSFSQSISDPIYLSSF